MVAEARVERRRQAGKGAVGCLIALIVVGIVAMVAYRVIPKRIAVAELQDYCEEQAERASLPEYGDEAITRNIVDKAHQMDLPVNPENIDIKRSGGEIHLVVRYTVPLTFPGYTYRWDVVHDVERVLF
jgi:hypothetical protein